MHGRFDVYRSIERAVALLKFEARIAKNRNLRKNKVPVDSCEVLKSFSRFSERNLDSVPFPKRKWFW